MIKTIFQRNPNLLTIFETSCWNSTKDVKTIENTLSKLASEIYCEYGITSNIPNIQITRQNNRMNKGSFIVNTNTIRLSYDLFVNKLKPPYYYKQKPISNILNNKECFETFIHELRHSLQARKFDIDVSKDVEFNWEMLNYNRENGQNKDIQSVFTVCDNDLSPLLYHIQPSERDAFLFAQAICEEFRLLMNQLYPNDLAFQYPDDFSQFNESVELSKLKFHTQTPFEDVDDIIRHINGVEPTKPLNQKMWEVVQQTQLKHHGRGLFSKFLYEDVQIEEVISNETEIDDIERN